MPLRSWIPLLLFLCATAGVCRADNRMWTDVTGEFQVEAELVDYGEDVVRLRRTNGAIIAVPREKLSRVDLAYLEGLSDATRGSENAAGVAPPGDHEGETRDAGAAGPPDPTGDSHPNAEPIPRPSDAVEAGRSGDDSTSPLVPSQAPPHVQLQHKLQAWWSALPDALRDRRQLGSLTAWLEWPLNGLAIAGWLGMAVVTGATALVLGRSSLGWFVVGLALPLLGLGWLLRLGDACLPPHRRSRALFALRALLIAICGAGLGYVAWMSDSLDGANLPQKLHQFAAWPSKILAALVAGWTLATYLTLVLAAILHRSLLGACCASLLPLAGNLLFAIGCRSRRAQTRWAIAFPLTRTAGRAQIRAMRASGQLAPATRVFWGRRLVYSGPLLAELASADQAVASLATEGIAATLRRLPKSSSLPPLRPSFAVGPGTAMLMVLVAVEDAPSAGSQASNTASPAPPAPATTGKRTVASLIDELSRTNQRECPQAIVAELVARKREAGPRVLEQLLLQIQATHQGARSGNAPNWRGCECLIQALARMRHEPAVVPMRYLSQLLANSGLDEQRRLAAELRSAADLIAGTPAAGSSGNGAIDTSVAIPLAPAEQHELEPQVGEPIRFPATSIICDMCAWPISPDDAYAVSPRYDVPADPSDVIRIYCSKCANERFFVALQHSQTLIEKSKEMALAHLRQTGRLR